MKVTGTSVLHAPPDQVFAAICDPATLLAIIPGCQSIEQVGPDEYRGVISLRLPAFAGSYRTTVRLVDAVPPSSAGLDGRVEGTLGSIGGHADFTLTQEGATTRIEYGGNAVIEGPLARLDSRFVEGLAGSLISQGLRTLDRRLEANRSEPAARSDRQPSTEAPA